MSPGEVVFGYRLERELGRGATSTVFAAIDPRRRERVALKVFSAEVAGTERGRARCRREVRAAAVVDHPAVVKARRLHQTAEPPKLAIVMDLLEGPSLAELRGDPLPPARARQAAVDLAAALVAAHRAGVVHRDLKPGNLLFRHDPRNPKQRVELGIIDFGCARPTADARAAIDGPGPSGIYTTHGAVIGTPAYMAPEQIGGRGEVGPPADVYALGELVFELFTGERAFPRMGAESVLQKKLRGQVPDLALPPTLDRTLGPTLRACLQADPAQRPSAAEVLSELMKLRPASLAIPAGMTAVATPPPTAPPPSQSARPARRGRRVVEQDMLTGVAVPPEDVGGDDTVKLTVVDDIDGASTLPLGEPSEDG